MSKGVAAAHLGVTRRPGAQNGQTENRDHEQNEENDVAGVLAVLPLDAVAGAKVALDGDLPERLRVVLDDFHVGASLMPWR